MRTRLAIIVALLMAAVTAGSMPVAHASDLVLAQEVGEDQGDADVDEGDVSNPGAEAETGQDEEGASDADAESGASEEESAGTAETETGPPWTYQMARMALALLVLTLLAVAFTYYQFVHRRQKGTA